LAAAAWRQNRAGAGAALIDGLFILPLVLPPTVIGFLLLLLFGRNGPFGKSGVFCPDCATVNCSARWP
jgi:molybdate transport system permease protein